MEIINLLSSIPGASISGVLLGMTKAHMQMKHEQELARLKVTNKDRENARQATNGAMQWMRLLVILIVCVAYFSKPFVAAFMNWPMWIAYTESHGFLMSWFYGDTDIMMRSYKGLVNSPIDNEVLVFIMSFLFGAIRS